ncbi:YicC/YloC family endoribonuclease [Paenibacillus gansuensis]|uniref:YicC/YloC family endoribonuclease n=1 Tax=Paenibacillus gansuensis TaxID=306542 RepID=A0ABW5PDC1_9BACL
MIYSMTGFGQADRPIGEYHLRVEAKSVNHRYSEVTVRIPREVMKYEDLVKKTVLRDVKRGRVDVFVAIERSASAIRRAEPNWPLLDGYIEAAKQIKERYGIGRLPEVSELMQLPDALLFPESQSADETGVWEEAITECTSEAVRNLQHMRRKEGASLELDLAERLQALISSHGQLVKTAPSVASEYRERLIRKLADCVPDEQGQLDQRLLTEVAIFAERSSIDEELTRLNSHFKQYADLLTEPNPVGRKLDFLLQEMNREVNTVGSKANHSELTRIVVEMKAELEKIREQVQNIE